MKEKIMKVEIGSLHCPNCGSPIPEPLTEGLKLTCSNCKTKLESVYLK